MTENSATENILENLTFERIDFCPVCESKAVAYAFSKEEPYFKRSFDIWHCTDCSAYFVSPRIERKHLAALYAADYYRGESWDSDTNYMSNYDSPKRLAELKLMYRRYYDQMRTLIGKENPRILDAGAGLGLFSQTVKSHYPSADIVSLDPSSFAVEHLKSLGLNAVHSELESYQTEEPFDGVFMREVLEHLYDPVRAVRNIARQMVPGGIFFYTTGNSDTVNSMKDWGYVRPAGHIVYYNRKSASILLHKCGFTTYPRELMRLGFGKKMSGRWKLFLTALGLRPGDLPIGVRNAELLD